VEQTNTVVEAIQAKIDGTLMITVGIEPQMSNSTELTTLTSAPVSNNRFLVPSFSALLNYTSLVVEAFCQG